MSARRLLWLWTLLGVALVWAVAVVGIRIFRSQRVTAEKVVHYLEGTSLRDLSADERARRIEELAALVNQLNFEERQKFRLEKRIRQTFREMTDAERARYLELTLPRGMQNLMDAFNKMAPPKRKQVVNRAILELSRASEQGDRNELEKTFGEENLKMIASEGMKAFFSEASAQTKLDLQPLIEQVQSILQMGR